MPLLAASDLTKSFGDVSVLSGVSCALEAGEKVGLVGRNGAGKTTFLRLLARLETPDRGAVSMRPGATSGYLPQMPEVAEGRTLWDEAASAFAGLQEVERRLALSEARLASPDVHGDETRLAEALDEYGRLRDRYERGGGFTYEAETRRTLSGLGFQEEQFRQSLASMSGGQRSRAALARLLLAAPDLLLLDEPTNHLDLEALEWLQGFLEQYRGALLLVSHDRYLLDAVTARTLELDAERLDDYPGNYSFYVTERAARRERQQELFERQQEEIASLRAYIQRYHAGQKSRQAKSREKRLARIQPIDAPRTARTLSFRLDAPRRGPQTVARIRNVTKRYESVPVLRHAAFEIRRGDKVGLIGPNGAGKTTLLRIIAGQVPPTSGAVELGQGVRVGYFAQNAEETLNLERPVLDEVLGTHPLSPEQVRTMLGRFLFSGEAVYKTVGQLSGGERRRVALAKMVLDRPDLLLLDEPTTHLDLPSLEALEAALRAFPGAMIVVSHDRYLLDHVAGRLLVLADGEVTEAAGPYHAYRQTVASGMPAKNATLGSRKPAVPTSAPAVSPGGGQSAVSRRDAAPAGDPAAPPDSAPPVAMTARSGQRARPEARHRGQRSGDPTGPPADEILTRIEALEREQSDLIRLMGDPELYRDAGRARDTVKRYEEVSAALEALYAALEKG
jgi:ATP-binding cassette, subfamily F, member 3